MTQIRRPYWRAAQLALLALAGWSVAIAFTSVLRSGLGREPGLARTDFAASHEIGQVRPVTDYLAMTRRDLFAAPSEEADFVGSGEAIHRASGDLQLLGTGGAGAAGYAIVEKKSAKEQVVVGIGDEIDGAELTGVGWRRARLRRGAGEELLVVPEDLSIEAARKTTQKTSSAPNSVSDENIKELGNDRWMVSQSEVEHQLENLSTLFTQMRAVPNMEDGTANGFRVFAIRRNSLFQKLGLKNNDVVQRVNGMDLNDPARALGLLEELKGENRLSVDVLRGGEPRTLTYDIR